MVEILSQLGGSMVGGCGHLDLSLGLVEKRLKRDGHVLVRSNIAELMVEKWCEGYFDTKAIAAHEADQNPLTAKMHNLSQQITMQIRLRLYKYFLPVAGWKRRVLAFNQISVT